MKTKLIILATILAGSSSAALAQSATMPAPTYVVTEKQYVIVTPQAKTREQVRSELQQARDSNQILLGENYPVTDIQSRPYGLLEQTAGRTSVGGQQPSGAQGSGQ